MLMIVYSMLTQVSLVKLLLAGFIPGFLSAVIYMTMIHILFRFKPGLGPRTSSRRSLCPVRIWQPELLRGP